MVLPALDKKRLTGTTASEGAVRGEICRQGYHQRANRDPLKGVDDPC